MSQFSYTFFKYLDEVKRTLLLSPTILGGFSSSSGGSGGPPGGFQGFLPQTRVAYDTTEAELQGFISPNPYNASGVLISGSLLDNLNHIRYRIGVIEAASGVSGGTGGGGIEIKNNGTIINSGITVLNFSDDFSVTESSSTEVSISLATIPELANIGKIKVSTDDTTLNYLENKIVAGNNIGITVLNNGANEQLQITASGGDHLVLVSTTDTTPSYLENKIVAGSGVVLTVLNEGSNEQIRVTASGVGLASVANIGKTPISPYGSEASIFVTDGEIDISDYPSSRNFLLTTDEETPIQAYKIIGGKEGDFLLLRMTDSAYSDIEIVVIDEPDETNYPGANIWSANPTNIVFRSSSTGDFNKELQFVLLVCIYNEDEGDHWLVLNSYVLP